MPRRHTVARKAKYEEQLVGTALTMDQFTNKLMRGGKRQLAARILQDAITKAEQQAGRSGVEVLEHAMRNAEFGFLGVIVRTWRQTPRFWGAPGIDTWRCRRLFQFLRMAGALILRILRWRPWRTSWLIVGTKTLLLSLFGG